MVCQTEDMMSLAQVTRKIRVPNEKNFKMLLTVKELANQLHIKPSTLYTWAGQGRIPCLKIHGLLRFRHEEIDRWVESFRTHEPSPTITCHQKWSRNSVDTLIARAKEHVYNPVPRGNQTEIKPHRKGGA
jgi:excisionase family DNA binding protein